MKFYACITSRLRRVCHCERGRSVRVINSPSNWGGVENASIGASDTVNAESASRSEKKKVKVNRIHWKDTDLHLLQALALKGEKHQRRRCRSHSGKILLHIEHGWPCIKHINGCR